MGQRLIAFGPPGLGQARLEWSPLRVHPITQVRASTLAKKNGNAMLKLNGVATRNSNLPRKFQ